MFIYYFWAKTDTSLPRWIDYGEKRGARTAVFLPTLLWDGNGVKLLLVTLQSKVTIFMSVVRHLSMSWIPTAVIIILYYMKFNSVGVDANRNWGHKWGGKGTSNNPCSQIYKGPKASSEPEVRHTQNFLVKLRDSLKLVLSLHSYSQVLLTPWG